MNSNCDLKICDFGLAKPIVDLIDFKLLYTEYVCTRWYRPPEVLLGWEEYDRSLDMWSVGCILAELYLRKPLFKGNCSEKQIELILELFGTPPIEEVYQKGRFRGREFIYKNGKLDSKVFSDLFTGKEVSKEGKLINLAIDFMLKCLKFDPSKRMTIQEALEHPFLQELYNPADVTETDPISRFDFMFEDDDQDIEELRELVVEEILLYHDIKSFQKYLREKKNYNEFITETTKLLNSSFVANKVLNSPKRKKM